MNLKFENIYKLSEEKDDIEEKRMSQEEFLEKWNKVKENSANIIKEFNALQRDKRLKNYATKNSALNKTFKILGMSLVSFSTLVGKAFKLINFFIPGADVFTGFAAPVLSPFRIAGQALINANSKPNMPRRVAPTNSVGRR